MFYLLQNIALIMFGYCLLIWLTWFWWCSTSYIPLVQSKSFDAPQSKYMLLVPVSLLNYYKHKIKVFDSLQFRALVFLLQLYKLKVIWLKKASFWWVHKSNRWICSDGWKIHLRSCAQIQQPTGPKDNCHCWQR